LAKSPSASEAVVRKENIRRIKELMPLVRIINRAAEDRERRETQQKKENSDLV
jgi:hypothetical protein